MAGRKPMLPMVDERPTASCKWERCLQAAVICEEVEYGKGRHNLCEYHYVKAHQLKAERWCAERGLTTTEQKRAYCRKLSKTLLKPMPLREPGEDDEERIAA